MNWLAAVCRLVFLVLGLSGCAVVELTAHAVKEVEKSQRDGGSRAASTPASPSEPSATREEEPPPVSVPAPRRSTVTVEELPAR